MDDSDLARPGARAGHGPTYGRANSCLGPVTRRPNTNSRAPARALLADARTALSVGQSIAWDDLELAVDGTRRLGWRRTTGSDLVETASYDGTTWTRRYAELGLDVTRELSNDDLVLASRICRCGSPTRRTTRAWFEVGARGKQVTLSRVKNGAAKLAFVMSFDDAHHLVAIRRRGWELAGRGHLGRQGSGVGARARSRHLGRVHRRRHRRRSAMGAARDHRGDPRRAAGSSPGILGRQARGREPGQRDVASPATPVHGRARGRPTRVPSWPRPSRRCASTAASSSATSCSRSGGHRDQQQRRAVRGGDRAAQELAGSRAMSPPAAPTPRRPARTT